jgi:hypothetical protein
MEIAPCGFFVGVRKTCYFLPRRAAGSFLVDVFFLRDALRAAAFFAGRSALDFPAPATAPAAFLRPAKIFSQLSANFRELPECMMVTASPSSELYKSDT